MRIIHDTSTGEQEIPPEALAQAFEDFMLARFYVDPNNKLRDVQARNLRNHLYRFLIEPIRMRTEVDPAHEFAYMGKQELIVLHGDLGNFEAFVVKRASKKQESSKDLMEAISEVQFAIEKFTNELS